MSIKTIGLTYTFGSGQSLTFPDIDCKANESWLLLGNSGSGKTTLLHLIAGMLRPTSGEVYLADTALSTLSSAHIDHFRGKHIGLMLQTPQFIKALSLGENLLLAQKLSGQVRDPKAAKDLLAQLGLEQYWHKYTFQLSQGEQQRAALARAVLHEPKIILADEPTAALDDRNTAVTVQLLDDFAQKVGATLLIVTHDQRLKSHYINQLLIH